MTLQHVPLKLANLNLSKCKVKMLRFRFLPQRGISRILVGISYILSNLQWTYNEWTYEWNSFWSTEGKGELGSGLFWGSETLFFCKDLLCFNKYVWLRVTRVKTIPSLQVSLWDLFICVVVVVVVVVHLYFPYAIWLEISSSGSNLAIKIIDEKK